MTSWFAVRGMVVIAVLGLSMALAMPVRAELRVHGDLTAWEEVVQTFNHLKAVTHREEHILISPTMKGAVVLRTEVVGNAQHSLMTVSGSTTETVAIGDKTWTLEPWRSGWQCPGVTTIPGPGEQILTGLWTGVPGVGDQGDVTVSRGTDRTVNSTLLNAYDLYYRNIGEKRSVTIYIAGEIGLPKAAHIKSGDGGEGNITYYDFGAAISITPPACT